MEAQWKVLPHGPLEVLSERHRARSVDARGARGVGHAAHPARAVRSSGGPRVPRLVRLAMVRDQRALRAHLERLADTPRLGRVIMSHGARVEREPGAFLRQVAATL